MGRSSARDSLVVDEDEEEIHGMDDGRKRAFRTAAITVGACEAFRGPFRGENRSDPFSERFGN